MKKRKQTLFTMSTSKSDCKKAEKFVISEIPRLKSVRKNKNIMRSNSTIIPFIEKNLIKYFADFEKDICLIFFNFPLFF